MSTDSRTALNKTLVTRLRDYADDNGRSVGAIADNRVYISQAPDDATYLYVVLRVHYTADPECSGRELIEIDAAVYGRPRAKEQEVELLAELVAKALWLFRESSSQNGLTFFSEVTTTAEALPGDPEDRELVIRHVQAKGTTWPQYLTSALT